MSTLGIRAAIGVPLLLGALALVLLAPLWLLGLIVALAAGLGMWEYGRLAAPGPLNLEALAGMALAALIPLAALLGPAAALAALGLAWLAGGLLALGRGPDLASAVNRLLRRGWGVLYTGGLLSCLLLLAGLANGRRLLLLLILVVVAADTGAYFVGHLLGRHRLAPTISPGKTVEGVAGGLAAGALVGALFAAFFLPDTSLATGAALGAGLALLGVGGDLMESALKRAAGAKDSGSLLPGHGGVLDRLDAIMGAAPGLLLARMLWWS